jgi:hypothetical protein
MLIFLFFSKAMAQQHFGVFYHLIPMAELLSWQKLSGTSGQSSDLTAIQGLKAHEIKINTCNRHSDSDRVDYRGLAMVCRNTFNG